MSHDYDSYSPEAVNRHIFDVEGIVEMKREILTDNEKLIYDTAIHQFLQDQSVHYRRLNSYGVREGVYMAIAYVGVPVEQFAWMHQNLEVLAAKALIYKETGEVVL